MAAKKVSKSKGRIAVFVEEIYEDLEAWYPILRFREAGYEVVVVGPTKGATYKSKHGMPLTADAGIDEIKASSLIGVYVPGGYAPDKMRRNAKMVKLVSDLFKAGKMVASICHGPWVLAEADVVRGRRFTCVGAIKTDIINAGGKYENAEVVQDGNLFTSRTPVDLPAQMKAILAFLES
ncbi:type 1 glutamine amidotransferase domain-containing protein [soil metagenome]